MKDSAKTKILFRIRSMETGGVQKVLLNILQNLDRTKFDAAVLLNIHQGELVNEIPRDIPVIALAKGRAHFSTNRILHKIQLLRRLIFLTFIQRYPGLIRKKIPFIPDVEVAMFHYNFSDVLKSPFKKSRKMGWMHSGISEFKNLVNTDKILRNLQNLDVSIHVSKATLEDIEMHLGHQLERSTVIYNAFDINEIHRRSVVQQVTLPKNSFVSVGRLSPQKGYDLLVEVHRELIDEGFSHHIIIAGEGKERADLANKIVEYGLKQTFILLGNLENPYPLMKSGDWYIQPSRYEAYPLGVGEALILGKPVIATHVGGVPEMMENGKTGIIVPFEKEPLKKAMQELIQNRNRVQHLTENVKSLNFEKRNQEIYLQLENLFTLK